MTHGEMVALRDELLRLAAILTHKAALARR